MSPSPITVTNFRIIQDSLITTTTKTITTTITLWPKIPVQGMLQKRNGEDMNAIAHSHNASSSVSRTIPLETSDTLAEAMTPGSTSQGSDKLPLILGITIPAVIGFVIVGVLLYWYFTVYRRDKLDEMNTIEYGKKKLHENSNPSSGSLSTFSSTGYAPNEKTIEKGNLKLENPYEECRIRHMAPIQKILIDTPCSAIRSFFNRKSMKANIYEDDSTDVNSLDTTVTKPLPLRTLQLVNRLDELKKENAQDLESGTKKPIKQSNHKSSSGLICNPGLRHIEENFYNEHQ